MPELPEVYPDPLDLSRYTETTRRELYDRVVAIQFTPVPDAAPGDWTGPTYTPDEAGLTVVWAAHRWFATWTDLDEPNLPPDQRQELVRIVADPSSPFGIGLEEV
jgi:hypothetical protein